MGINAISRYSYPSIIQRVISEFVAIVSTIFEDDRLGVLLVGSTSRGELCWCYDEDQLIVYSDIEFMLAVNACSAEQQKQLSDEIDKLSARYQFGNRFHIDYVVNRWSKLGRLDRKVFVFDCKNKGIDLTENYIVDALPNVDISNLDFHDLNDILLHRLKAVVKDVPDEIFNGSEGNNALVLSIAKNTLDVTTWLYPYEAEKLLSGFECRLSKWVENRDHLVLAEYFDEEDFSFLHECLNIRRNPTKKHDEMALLKKFIRIYESAIKYCKAMNGIDNSVAIDNNTASSKLFGEFRIKRRFMEAYLILKNVDQFSVANILLNVFSPRKGKQITFCLNMIKAIADNYGDSRSDNKHLARARNQLNRLKKIHPKSRVKFSDDWKELRNAYISLNKVFI